MFRLFVFLGSLIVLIGCQSAPSEQASQSPYRQIVSSVHADELAKKDPEEQIVCRLVKEIGSNRRTRQCVSRAALDEASDVSREHMREVQRRAVALDVSGN